MKRSAKNKHKKFINRHALVACGVIVAATALVTIGLITNQLKTANLAMPESSKPESSSDSESEIKKDIAPPAEETSKLTPPPSENAPVPSQTTNGPCRVPTEAETEKNIRDQVNQANDYLNDWNAQRDELEERLENLPDLEFSDDIRENIEKNIESLDEQINGMELIRDSNQDVLDSLKSIPVCPGY